MDVGEFTITVIILNYGTGPLVIDPVPTLILKLSCSVSIFSFAHLIRLIRYENWVEILRNSNVLESEEI